MEKFKAEILALQEGCGFTEESYGHLRMKGPDTLTFLHRLLTNNVQALPVGGVQWNALCDRKGKVKSLFELIKCSEESCRLIGERDTLQKTRELLAHMLFSEQITITDETDQHHLFFLAGPKTKELFQKRWKMLPDEPFRLNYTPEERTFFWFENLYDQPLWRLITTKKNASNICEYFFTEATPVSKNAFEMLRLEAAIPKYGVDITEENILLEGNLSHAYARAKGCYPGQEVIERLHTYADAKTPKVITKIEVDGNIVIDGATSSLFNPVSGKTVGFISTKRERK